jgi:hypothetical protein
LWNGQGNACGNREWENSRGRDKSGRTGHHLGFAIGSPTNADLGAIFLVFELQESIFAHQIDDSLDLFNIHRRVENK